jgi:hypothetical protein
MIVAAAIVLAAGIIVFLLMQGTRKEAEVLLQQDSVRITGQYGISFKVEDIKNVQLSITLPAVGAKTNGASLGDIKKGDFMIDGIGKCRLFLQAKNGPYLFITLKDGKTIIMSYPSAEKTVRIYQELISASGVAEG